MDCKTAQQMITPYIGHRLSDQETEEFIEHIRGCKACSEELEVYFTVYYALKQLDNEKLGTYNIKEMLERDLRQRETRVRNHSIVRFYERVLMVVFSILAAIFLFTAGQVFLYGSFEETTLYNLFSAETEPPAQMAAPPDRAVATETEESEQETNRKRQVIVTTPETEAR